MFYNHNCSQFKSAGRFSRNKWCQRNGRSSVGQPEPAHFRVSSTCFLRCQLLRCHKGDTRFSPFTESHLELTVYKRPLIGVLKSSLLLLFLNVFTVLLFFQPAGQLCGDEGCQSSRQLPEKQQQSQVFKVSHG